MTIFRMRITIFSKWKLVIYLSNLLLSLAILVACNQAGETSILTSETDSTPALYSGEDLSNAVAAKITSFTELEGEDLSKEEININLLDLEENLFEETSNLTTQDTLPTGSGIAAYYRTDGNTYQIQTRDQATNVKTNIYSSIYEVQSVAVNSSGSLVVASIKNPANGFFDIYVFDDGKPMLNLSNTNDRDELDVSVTADGTKIVWAGPARNGRIKVQICGYDSATQSCAKSTLGNTNAKDQRQPSITSNGKYIALIRDIGGGKRRIFLYDVMNNTYIRVFTSVNEVRYPSASDDGKYLMFLEVEGTERKVRIKNRDTNEIANELTSKSIKKAHMQSSGNYYIFDSFTTGHQRVFTANIDTNERARADGGRWDYGGEFWQQCNVQTCSNFSMMSTDCDAASSVGDTCTIMVQFLGSNAEFKGFEFTIMFANGKFELVVLSATTSLAGWTATNSTSKVSAFGPVTQAPTKIVSLTIRRTGTGSDVVNLDNVFVLGDGTNLSNVSGSTYVLN